MPGLDRQIVDAADHETLLARVRADIRTDFILAPHLNSVFVNAADELWEEVAATLRSGTYEPALPVTISVPKERGFARPGSILLPPDRLVYQLLIDTASAILEDQLDRNRTFSHVLVHQPDAMFEPAHESWGRFQARVLEMCRASPYVVKADIANYFERIPQHHLINLMSSSGCPGPVVNLMEEILLAFQERDSFGIIQGVYPSDVLGNFFLSEFDAYCELNGIASARYVDDIFIGYASETEAKKGLVSLIEHLRREGLHLNEHKSGIHLSEDVVREETAIDDLFEDARREARERLAHYVETGYGFTAEWELYEEPDDENVELSATVILYNAKNEYPEQAEKIDKFSLPLLRAIGSDYAVDDVLEALVNRPHLARLYHSYLSRFAPESQLITERLAELIVNDAFVTDYERMYVMASLMNAEAISREACNTALQWLQSTVVTIEARALAALFVARHGNPKQKRAVRLAYENEPSDYVRGAQLYASRYFTTAERRTCRRAWGGHSTLNALISQALANAT